MELPRSTSPLPSPLLLLHVLLLLLLQPVPTVGSDVYYSIKEGLSPGTVFGDVVEHSDLKRKVSPDDLNKLRFRLLTIENSNSKYFAIQARTGVLSVASKIDRETVCSFRRDCTLTVRAAVQMDLGSFFHIIRVHVDITDVNDNAPTFSQPVFQINIPENAQEGAMFPLPTAFDKDTGANNTVKDYFLVSGHPTFSLASTHDNVGNIQIALQLLKQLNREDTATINVLVAARDGGRPPMTGTLTVEVIVSDINDNYPLFDKYNYQVNVSETTRTNIPFLRIHANDEDVGLNGNLSYSFSKLQPRETLDLFRMGSLSGELFLARSVENHTGSTFELVVEASDMGAPPKVARALVRVRVLDTVNSRPDIIVEILSSSRGQAEASEYAEVGKVVAYVSVNDPDSGKNGVTVCRLNTEDFELQSLNNQGEYKVILVTNLDRERTDRYHISVRCNDFGLPQLESSKSFEVIVRDENDNRPQFSSNSYFTVIAENRTQGAVIAQLTVTDADEGKNAEVVYRVSGAHVNEFTIFDNGTMIATAPLDREVSEKLVVKVIAVDKGYPSLSGSATVFITLEDVNDQAPSFSDKGSYSFSVAEDARVGSFVGIVAADDADQGVNAEITFMEVPNQALGPSGQSFFMITKDGVVKTNRPLDREKKDRHFFTVLARDGGAPPLSTTASLTIHIDDVNDNTPRFIYPTELNDTLSIAHTFPVRSTITQIRATDADAGHNSALVYSCASANDSGLFGMDPRTGELFLQRYVSRRQIGTYVLRVNAHDEGTPQLSNQTLLFLDIFFDNSTLLNPAQAAAPSKAVMTALILVGVVLVVGVVAVVVLVCVRRQEAKKKQEATSGGGQPATTPTKLQAGGYYIAPGVCESPAFGGGLAGNGAVLNKPVPEQALDGGAGGTGGPPLSEFPSLRTANPYVIMPPHSNYSDSEGPAEIIEISRNGLFHRAEDPFPGDESDRGADDSHFSTFRSQEGARGSHFRQNSLQRHPGDEDVDDVKRADDTLSLSELSYQSTSDSGRGGSEFDVNNVGNKEKMALHNTSSPLPFKGGHHSHHHHQQPSRHNSISNASNNNNNINNNSHNTSLTSNGSGGGTYRPRGGGGGGGDHQEVSFTTFRGDSPCSFRFDSDNDTLTRGHHRPGQGQGQGHPPSHQSSRASPLPLSSTPHARSLHSLGGGGGGGSANHPSSAHFRPLVPYQTGVDSPVGGLDEANSLGRRVGSQQQQQQRRAVTPGADFSNSSRGGYPPAFNFSVSGGGGGGGGYRGVDMDLDRRGGGGGGVGMPPPSSFHPPPPYDAPPEYSSMRRGEGRGGGGGGHSNNGAAPPPSVEFRGRNSLGGGPPRPPLTSSSSFSSGRGGGGGGAVVVPEYVNAYSDLDSGDDMRHDHDHEHEHEHEHEPTEDEYLLPPYPTEFESLQEEREEENVDGDEVWRDEQEEGELGNVSERSALNFVPGVTNASRISNDSYRARRSSEV